MIFLTRHRPSGSVSTFQLYVGGQIRPDGTYEQGTPIGRSFTTKTWPLGTHYLREAARSGTVPVGEAESAIASIAITASEMKLRKQSVRQL